MMPSNRCFGGSFFFFLILCCFSSCSHGSFGLIKATPTNTEGEILFLFQPGIQDPNNHPRPPLFLLVLSPSFSQNVKALYFPSQHLVLLCSLSEMLSLANSTCQILGHVPRLVRNVTSSASDSWFYLRVMRSSPT